MRIYSNGTTQHGGQRLGLLTARLGVAIGDHGKEGLLHAGEFRRELCLQIGGARIETDSGALIRVDGQAGGGEAERPTVSSRAASTTHRR